MAKEVDIIVKATDKASDVLSWVAKNSTKMADKINAVAKKVRNVTWAITAWIVAMWKKRVDAGNVQIEQETKLTTILKQRANATDEQIQKIKDLTSAEQKLWIIGDEVQLAWAQQLATFVWQTETIETLLPAMNNLLAQQAWYTAGTSDAVNIWNLMWKVLQWQTSALTRVWITFTEAQEQVLKFWTEEERAAMLAQVITDNVWEMNKAMADTFQWRLTQVQNTIWDIWETLWMALMPVLQDVLEKVAPIVEKIADWITNNQELAWKIILIWWAITWLTFVLSALMPVITSVITLLSSPVGWFIAVLWLTWTWLNLLEQKIVSTDEQLQIYYDQVNELNTAYENGLIDEEEYRAKMQELELQIQATKDKANTFWQYLKNELNNTLQAITSPIRTIKDLWNDWKAVLPQIQEKFVQLTEKIKWFIDKVKDAINAIKDFVRESASSGLWSWIVSAWISIWTSILKWRAVGWPVSANTPYIVGEEWPELFVPNTSWNIVPNDQMWNITVNVNFGGVAVNNWSDEVALAETITETITRNLELYKKGIY